MILRSRDSRVGTAGKSLRPKSVTHVAGTKCYPCLRAGPPRTGGAGRIRTADTQFRKVSGALVTSLIVSPGIPRKIKTPGASTTSRLTQLKFWRTAVSGWRRLRRDTSWSGKDDDPHRYRARSGRARVCREARETLKPKASVADGAFTLEDFMTLEDHPVRKETKKKPKKNPPRSLVPAKLPKHQDQLHFRRNR